jgi:hypothetical protein
MQLLIKLDHSQENDLQDLLDYQEISRIYLLHGKFFHQNRREKRG